MHARSRANALALFAIAALLAGLIAATAGNGASSTSVVGATVLSATSIDTSGCAPGSPQRTDFGSVLAGASLVTTLDCSIQFGSSNNTSQLRIAQSDGRGVGMWQPSRGALDTSFNATGTTSTAGGAGWDVASALAEQVDGKIVAAGSCSNGANDDMCLVRYDVNGGLDTSFDVDGIVTTDFAGSTDDVNAVAVQPDGKIVAAGACSMGVVTDIDFCIARYNTNGSLDTSFDTDGRVTTAIAVGARNDLVYGMVLQSDGKVVVAGRCYLSGTSDYCLARYDTNGALDAYFGTAGVITTDFAAANDGINGIAIQPDGKLVVAGDCYMGAGPGWRFCLARYSTQGQLDATFDVDGRVTTEVGDEDVRGMAVQPDGKIVVAGFCYMGVVTDYDTCMTRHLSDGSLDATFGTGGIATAAAAPGNGYDATYGMTLRPDGRILAAGECDVGGATEWDMCLMQFRDDGSLDPAFGTNGIVSTAIAPGTGDDVAYAVTNLTDGRIAIAGFCRMPSVDFCIAKYDRGGTVQQYSGGSADWATPSTSLFAVCLRSVATATATWTANATCPASDGIYWNAVPTAAAPVAAAGSGVTTATANFRFGLRTAANQRPGAYIAPITFDVTAP